MKLCVRLFDYKSLRSLVVGLLLAVPDFGPDVRWGGGKGNGGQGLMGFGVNSVTGDGVLSRSPMTRKG